MLTVLISLALGIAGGVVGTYLPRLYPKWPRGTTVLISNDYVDPLPGDPPAHATYLHRKALTRWHRVKLIEGPSWWGAARRHETITIDGKYLQEANA